MTRDEAVKILTSQWNGCSDAFGLVTALSSLGILKLEDAEDRAYSLLKDAGLPPTEANNFIDILKKNGLQIIEKGQ